MMQINVNGHNGIYYEKAERYLPVRLTTTYFEDIGECVCIVANREDNRMANIVEDKNSEVFITPMDTSLYDDIKHRVLNMEFWTPNKWYNTAIGLADGVERKIHLDCDVF